jgi:hypothetical protein
LPRSLFLLSTSLASLIFAFSRSSINFNNLSLMNA